MNIVWKRTATRPSANRDPSIDYEAIVGGQMLGGIDAEFDAIDKGYTLKASYTYAISAYAAWTKRNIDGASFEVSRYGSAPAALAAAKAWVAKHI